MDGAVPRRATPCHAMDGVDKGVPNPYVFSWNKKLSRWRSPIPVRRAVHNAGRGELDVSPRRRARCVCAGLGVPSKYMTVFIVARPRAKRDRSTTNASGDAAS